MSVLRRITRGLRVLVRRESADRELADEVEHYFTEATAALEASGLSPAEARRAARLELGDPAAVREEVRTSGWEEVLGTVLGDVRQGARRLRRSPGFTLVSVTTLALGIGASTAIFSAVNPILFEPLAYPHPDRIVMVWDYAGDGSRLPVTFGTYREVAARSRSFEALAPMKPWRPALTGPAEPERLEGQRVGADYFRALGAPAIGGGFRLADDRVNGPNVVVVSDAFWRQRFAGDPAILGRVVRLDDESFTVVGVMPPDFADVSSAGAQVWAPLQYDASLPPDGREWGHHLRLVGRLRAGVSPERAARELERIARSPVPEFARPPWASWEQGLSLKRLQDDVTEAARPALLAVLGAVLLVLVIACVNVTNLLLARGAQRRGEFAVRVALGAGRRRLTRQLLTESLLLAALGGALGLVLAQIGVRALVALSPPGLPRVDAIRLDATAFAFAVGVTTLVGLLVGLVPALDAARADPQAGLKQASRRTLGGHQRTRRTLVVAEVALALVLLVSAGLLLRSLERLFAIDPGFDPSHVVSMQVQASGHRLDREATHRFFADALEAARRVPGVVAASFTSQLPLSGGEDVYGVRFESSPTGNPQAEDGAFRYAVLPGYLETMAIPLRRGRRLDAGDVAGRPPVVVVSESLARSAFPGVDPIGQRLRIGGDEQPWATIVGVVGDVRQTSLAAAQADAVYIPATQWRAFADDALWLVARTRGDAAALAPALKKAVWSVDKDQPIVRVATMADRLAATAADRRFALTVFEAFGLAALLLATTGIYGLLAGGVAERMREIGVRSVLGASRRDILALVVREGMALASVGIAIGLSGAAAASGGLVSLLFGVSRLDPLTYLGVVALLLAAAALACALPAWRAARVDPATTLRTE